VRHSLPFFSFKMSLPNDCWQKVLAFLNHKESLNVKRVNKNLRTVVQKHTYEVIVHGVWDLAYPTRWGSLPKQCWEHVTRILGKDEAKRYYEKQKETPNVTWVGVYDSQTVPIGWVSNYSDILFEWPEKNSE